MPSLGPGSANHHASAVKRYGSYTRACSGTSWYPARSQCAGLTSRRMCTAGINNNLVYCFCMCFGWSLLCHHYNCEQQQLIALSKAFTMARISQSPSLVNYCCMIMQEVQQQLLGAEFTDKFFVWDAVVWVECGLQFMSRHRHEQSLITYAGGIAGCRGHRVSHRGCRGHLWRNPIKMGTLRSKGESSKRRESSHERDRLAREIDC